MAKAKGETMRLNPNLKVGVISPCYAPKHLSVVLLRRERGSEKKNPQKAFLLLLRISSLLQWPFRSRSKLPECVKSRGFCHPRESGDPVLDNLHWIPAFAGMTTSRMFVFTQSVRLGTFIKNPQEAFLLLLRILNSNYELRL
jgi:hypothetical protein